MPKVNPNKCSAEECFTAARDMAGDLNHKVVKDSSRKAKSVMSLYRMTAGWIPQPTDNVATTKSGNASIKNWGVQELVQNKTSWEALGIEKGKLPNTTIICPITGDEIYPPITMNGIIIDTNSPEFIRRIKEIVSFPPSLLHEALEIIETTYLKYFDDKSQGVRKKQGPYDVLHKVQGTLIQLQNKLFASRQSIEENIKTLSGQIVTTHQAAIIMKEKLELAIAMSEMANSTFTRASDHDIACRIVECYRNAFPKATFANPCESLQLAGVLQTAKTAIDNGETLNIDILLSNIVGAFQPKDLDEPDSLQAAMMASSAHHERPARFTSGSGATSTVGGGYAAGGASFHGKRRYVESGTQQQYEIEDQAVMNERIIKALNDLKSDMGFVKKHMMSQESAKHTEAQVANSTKFSKKNLEHAQHNTKGAKFAGVAKQATAIPRPLVDRVITTIDSSDSEGEKAFMTMRVVQQIPIATNNYRIMTADNNATVLGDHCPKKVQGSVGSKLGITMLNSMRIVDPIQDLEHPQSIMTMNPLSCFSGMPDGISPSAWKAIESDIDMRNDQDALKLNKYADKGSTMECPLLTPKMTGKVQKSLSPPPEMTAPWPMTNSPELTIQSPAASSPTPSVPQVENFALDANPNKTVAMLAPLDQENDKPIEPGFGRPCTRSITRINSYVIPPAIIPFDQENELDPTICTTKPRGGHRDPLAPINTSLSHGSDTESSSGKPPELVPSSDDDDEK